MPGLISFELKGVAELERTLKELGPRVATNVSGAGLRAWAKPIVKKARELVRQNSHRTGILEESITTKLHRVRGTRRVMDIGFKSGPGFASWRAHFVEFGTAHSAAEPFIRPALDEGGDTGTTDMVRALWAGIEREAKRRGGPSPTDAGESEGDI